MCLKHHNFGGKAFRVRLCKIFLKPPSHASLVSRGLRGRCDRRVSSVSCTTCKPCVADCRRQAYISGCCRRRAAFGSPLDRGRVRRDGTIAKHRGSRQYLSLLEKSAWALVVLAYFFRTGESHGPDRKLCVASYRSCSIYACSINQSYNK